jgi:hypothetical protein
LSACHATPSKLKTESTDIAGFDPILQPVLLQKKFLTFFAQLDMMLKSRTREIGVNAKGSFQSLNQI